MKKLNHFSAFVFALIGLFIGMFIGAPYATAAAGALIAYTADTTPKTGMIVRAGLDLTAVVADIENYWRKHNNDIWVQILKGVDFEAYMKKIPKITGDYIATTSRRTEFLQAYQKGFQPKGGVEMVPYTNKCRQIKMDYLEDNLHQLFDQYLAYLVNEKTTPDKYPYVKWLINEQIIPGMTEEFRNLSVKGQYVAPTTGVAGDSINSTDGIMTIVANEVTAGNIVPITTGAITPANVVDLIEDFVKSLPYEYRSKEDNIFIADDLLQEYKYTYRDQYGTNQDFDGPTAKVWGTNKTLVGLPQHNGSQRILYTPKGNMLCLYNEYLIKNPTVQLFERDVKLLADMHRGYGFETLEEVFANDQA